MAGLRNIHRKRQDWIRPAGKFSTPRRLIVADGQAIAPSTKPLVGGVVHRLADEVDAPITKAELSTLRMARAEAVPEVPVALGDAVGHAGNPVIGIALLGCFLLTS